MSMNVLNADLLLSLCYGLYLEFSALYEEGWRVGKKKLAGSAWSSVRRPLAIGEINLETNLSRANLIRYGYFL